MFIINICYTYRLKKSEYIEEYSAFKVHVRRGKGGQMLHCVVKFENVILCHNIVLLQHNVT